MPTEVVGGHVSSICGHFSWTTFYGDCIPPERDQAWGWVRHEKVKSLENSAKSLLRVDCMEEVWEGGNHLGLLLGVSEVPAELGSDGAEGGHWHGLPSCPYASNLSGWSWHSGARC